ncbi:TnsA endonuclease N-terminal domain-containing protein [Paracandidimonas lactea]|uniref:TnsA endonuclease N-terminal domain-containing protein n=1 Tax=Paracandidimonas lactea TaxID=2895524 RepID=UPI001F36C87A|nr:TnsA endonuclease N-terminal domain-containing protein [Paracandidimonas lactea]
MPNTSKKPRSRTVITPSGGIVRGKFPSKKNGRMIHHEGLLELEACYLFEMSPRVMAYNEQPQKISYVANNRIAKYFPDFELQLDTGETVLVEIKHSTILARAEIEEKYSQINAHMQRTYQSFSILTEASIRQEPRLCNLRLAYRELLPHAPTHTWLDSLLPHLAALQNPSIHEVNVMLKPYGVCAFDLLASGHLTCDLTRPLASSTRVSLNYGGESNRKSRRLLG